MSVITPDTLPVPAPAVRKPRGPIAEFIVQQPLGAASFLALDANRQDAVLQATLGSDAEGAHAIAWTLRKRAFSLYYTDPAVMAAFAYSGPPQPGGFPDFQDAPT